MVLPKSTVIAESPSGNSWYGEGFDTGFVV
jgi:hypothetical protein